MSDIFQSLIRYCEEGRACSLVLITAASGSTPRSVGARMLIISDGSIEGTIGGGNLEKTAMEKALESLQHGKTLSFEYDLHRDLGMECGGRVQIYIEPFLARPRLLVFGAGHIGRQLAPLAEKVGFQVTIIDERPEFATANHFPASSTVMCQESLEFCRSQHFSARDHVVIVTHNHVNDQAILEHMINEPVAYLGMIGSSRKSAVAFDRLRERGVEEDRIAKVKSPIGLGVKAETPEEIALLIAAELVLQRYQRPE